MVNTYKLKLTLLQQEILRFLFNKAGAKFNVRKISIELNVSLPGVSKSLPLLVKQRLINLQKDKETERYSIELNLDNPFVIGLKRANNLKQMYESGLIDYLYKTLHGATIILFGSYSYGEDTINSDIDIAVVGIKKKDINLARFEKLLEREIIVNYYNSLNKIDKNILNSILSGIVLKGEIDL